MRLLFKRINHAIQNRCKNYRYINLTIYELFFETLGHEDTVDRDCIVCYHRS